MPAAASRGSIAVGHGFSLLELAVVVSIIAILAAIAIPRYAAAIVQERLDATARRIVLDLTFAQRQARMSSASRSVAFTAANHSYTLTGIADPDHPGNTYTVNLSKPPYEATIMSASFGSGTQITFDGYGLPLNGVGGSVVIQVGSRIKTVTIDGASGAVSVQ